MSKIWVFYIKEVFKEKVVFELGNDLVYGWTDNKEYYKQFKHDRNMDKFISKVFHISSKEFNAFYKTHKNQKLVKLEGKTKAVNSVEKFTPFSIVVTSAEKSYTNKNADVLLERTLLNLSWVDPSVFEDKYKKSLHNIKYDTFHNILINGWDKKCENKIIINMNMFSYVSPDLFSLFISLYKDLF